MAVTITDSTDDDGEQLKAILATTVDGIVTIDERGAIQRFNHAAERMFGYKAAEVLGRSVSMLMPQPVADEHDQYIAGYLRTGQARIIGIGREVVGLRKDGTHFPMELAVSEVMIKGRRSFTGIIRDISDRRQLEAQIIEVSEREQRRIARDLHDGLCQELAGVTYLVQTTHEKRRADATIASRKLEEISRLLQATLRHARTLARGLHPVDSLPAGLMAALGHLAADTSASGVSCQFRSIGSVEIHDSVLSTHLYRIAQEWVRDAVQSAKAQRLIIRLQRVQGGITMQVSDNAIRPEHYHTHAGNMLMKLIQYRAHIISGRIAVQRRKGGGMLMTCEVPDQNGAYENNEQGKNHNGTDCGQKKSLSGR